MTKSDGDPHRQDDVGKPVDVPNPVDVPELEPDLRPAPQYGSPIGRPPGHHDSERQPPPPVSGSID